MAIFTRRALLAGLGIGAYSLARSLRTPLLAEEIHWRGTWGGQDPLRQLSFGEALEILFDKKAPNAFKGCASCIIFIEIDKLLAELGQIIQKAQGNFGPYLSRIQQIVTNCMYGIQSYQAWMSYSAEGQREVPIWFTKIAARIP